MDTRDPKGAMSAPQWEREDTQRDRIVCSKHIQRERERDPLEQQLTVGSHKAAPACRCLSLQSVVVSAWHNSWHHQSYIPACTASPQQLPEQCTAWCYCYSFTGANGDMVMACRANHQSSGAAHTAPSVPQRHTRAGQHMRCTRSAAPAVPLPPLGPQGRSSALGSAPPHS